MSNKKIVKNSDAPIVKEEKLLWQGAQKIIKNRIFKIRSPRGHGTGFHIGNFGGEGNLCAVATAYHVIRDVHDWGEPIKLVHAETGKEFILKEKDRPIFTYPSKDLAIILFILPKDLILPSNPIDFLPSNFSLFPGVDVAWCGFPAVRGDKLCFFHGYISCYLDKDNDYLVDGVAINGVSGGPVFFIDPETNKPRIAGVITAYIANRVTGETLPGLSMITSIAPCEETIKSLKTISQAEKEAAKQNLPKTDISNSDSKI